MKNNRILIIDDDPGIRQAYLQILSPEAAPSSLATKGAALFGSPDHGNKKTVPSRECFTLSMAENGTHAVELARLAQENAQPFAAAFIDMKMPGIDGAETAKRIWAIDPEIKIVIITAYTENSPQEITDIIGRKDLLYLRKPFNSEEIRQLAVALTQHWNVERERDASNQQLREAHAKLDAFNKDLQTTVDQQASLLVHAEKMSSIGILAAGVAHEINNPMAYIHANLETMKAYSDKIRELLGLIQNLTGKAGALQDGVADTSLASLADFIVQQDLTYILSDIDDLVKESLDGAVKVKEIVDALRAFSHAGEEKAQQASVNAILDDAIKVAWNEIKYKAELFREYDPDLPLIECNRQSLGQVFMNVIMNAVQAVTQDGRIKIVTRSLSDPAQAPRNHIEIRISDNGPGIAPELLPKIFDPFLTTKPVGQGTGLGLSISYDIVRKHGGEIRAESRPGQGATFVIQLPECSASPTSDQI